MACIVTVLIVLFEDDACISDTAQLDAAESYALYGTLSTNYSLDADT